MNENNAIVHLFLEQYHKHNSNTPMDVLEQHYESHMFTKTLTEKREARKSLHEL